MMNTDGEVRLTDLIPVDTLQKIHIVLLDKPTFPGYTI